MGQFIGAKALQMFLSGLGARGNAAATEPFGRMFSHSMNLLYQNVPPPAEMLMHAGHTGIISTREAQVGLAVQGIAFSGDSDQAMDAVPEINRPFAQLWNRVYASTRPAGGIALVHELANRGTIDREDAYRMLQRIGYHPDKELPHIWRLRKVVPPIADLIRFAVKDVFDPAAVARLRLLDDYPKPPFTALCRAQGLGNLSGADVRGLGNPIDMAELYWAAHWQPLSPTQCYEMYQRLRPDRLQNFQAVAPGVQAFTLADLHQALKIADYPPGVRDWLVAISFRKPRLVDVLRFRQLGVTKNKDESQALYQDIGYSPVDAGRLAEHTEREVRRRVNLGKWGASKALLIRMRELGMMQEGDMRTLLTNSGLSPEEVNLAIQVIAAEVDRRFLDQVVRGIRSRYFRGVANANDARNQLFGVVPDPAAADRIWQTWQAAFTETRRALSAEKIQSLARKGIIDLGTAVQRLANLGYSEEDRAVLLSEVVYDRAVQAARAAQAQARTQRQQQQAQQQAVAALQRATQQEQRALAKHASPTQLGRWLEKGLIGPDETRDRLEQMGWRSDDAERLIKEKGNGKATPPQKAPPGGKAP